jgi:CRISPR-associated protein Csb1
MMTIDSTSIDAWADDLRGAVALHLRQQLVPAEGEGSVIFPPTYAMGDKREGAPYAVDRITEGLIVQIDSVGSQANRMEPLFRQSPEGMPSNPLADLVPQIEIVISVDYSVSILDVGHRLGDALVRSSAMREESELAFADFAERGDAMRIAKLAPTSLVFGAWDSRGSGAKVPRIVQSVIRARRIDALRRSAQYNPAIDYARADVFSDEDKQKAEGNTKSPMAQRGFVHVPAVDTHGGVIAHGPIERDVTINLVALRQLSSPNDGKKLRRYIMGLALVAATEPQDGFLRQGCLLTPNPDAPGVWILVERNGRRVEVALDETVAHAYARAVAKDFGVAEPRRVSFKKELAKADVSPKDDKKKKT